MSAITDASLAPSAEEGVPLLLMTPTEAASKIRKENLWLYQNALDMVHTSFYKDDGMCPQAYCLRYLEVVLGLNAVENDPLFSLLEKLEDTGYWWNNWAPYMDDDEREYLFKDEDSLEEAMDAIRVYIKRFYAASKIQAVFRGFLTREDTEFRGFINPNDWLDNAPPDSLEGLEFGYYGTVESHLNWGQWLPNLNHWVHQCSSQIYTWWWDFVRGEWVRDTTEAVFERFEGK